jgi:hypothetical protein
MMFRMSSITVLRLVSDDLASQYFLPNNGGGEFSLVDAELTVEAIRLGDPFFVYITFAISTALLLAMYAEAFRTRAWASLPLWNFTDMTCLVLSGAVAGSDLLGELYRDGDRRSMYWAGHGDSWTRRSLGVDRAAGIEALPQLRFQLGRKTTGLSQSVDEKGVVCINELTAISLQTDFAKDTVPLLKRKRTEEL